MIDFLTQNISTGEVIGIFIFLILVVIVLLILIIINNRRIQDVTYPVYDYIVKGAHDKAKQITYEARKDARKLLVDAELEGVKVVAKEKIESKHIEEEYEEKLDKLTEATEELLSKYGKQMDENLKRLVEGVEKRVAAGIAKNETFLQEETNKLSKQLSNTFTTLEANAKEQIRGNVEKEFIAVKKVVETYRQERYALIDSELLSLIENTTQLALQKTLSLSEHTDLIYRALEEAKSKNTFS